MSSRVSLIRVEGYATRLEIGLQDILTAHRNSTETLRRELIGPGLRRCLDQRQYTGVLLQLILTALDGAWQLFHLEESPIKNGLGRRLGRFLQLEDLDE